MLILTVKVGAGVAVEDRGITVLGVEGDGGVLEGIL